MLQRLPGYVIALALLWAIPGCASAPVRDPESRLRIRFSGLAGIHPLRVVVTIQGDPGATVDCASIYFVVNGLPVSGQEVSCAPGEAEDGGITSRELWFSQGVHTLVVEASEPGRRPVREARSVVVL